MEYAAHVLYLETTGSVKEILDLGKCWLDLTG